MVTLSTASLYFTVFLVLGAFLLRNNHPARAYIFLIMNLAVYIAGAICLGQLVTALVWIAVPYLAMTLYGRLSKTSRIQKYYKTVLITVMVIMFSYLMKYDVIFEGLHIPYLFAWKLLGLSYFLFRQIDFIMQYEYLKEENVRVTVVDYLNYCLSFYTLLAGPILRYEEFVSDFYSEITPCVGGEFVKAINRAVNGYLKVYVVSGVLAHYAGVVFAGMHNHSGVLTTVLAFVVFAFLNGWYIYFNFSGYCDIIIAFAKVAGLSVHENFNQPYLSRSVVEFWNRHHITLSEWIRDYIFSPLFKMLISGPCANNAKMGQYIALFVTFTIAGIWHGTDANYLIYGLFQGLGIVVATAFKDKRKKLLGKERNKAYEKNIIAITAGRCVTWMYICLTFSFVGYDVVGMITEFIG